MKSLIAGALAILLAAAVNTANGQPDLEIEAAENATHIVGITPDTLQLVVGRGDNNPEAKAKSPETDDPAPIAKPKKRNPLSQLRTFV